ncbi:hypothetical protein ABZ835_32300 [Streptomyces sp. NPDC047461]|uniref:hypothetical protein n=1 Tax=Streptomyces sp. NPDC047461 TaxID=3155619 RepID=UPI003400CB2F
MNPADLMRLRTVERTCELERMWQLLDPFRADLTQEQYDGLQRQYSRYHDRLVRREQDGTAAGVDAFERDLVSLVVGRLLEAESGRRGATPAARRLLTQLAGRAGPVAVPLTGLEFEPRCETWSPLTSLVRLRVSGSGFWELPVLAHEFAHCLITDAPAVDRAGAGGLREVRDEIARDLRSDGDLWWSDGAETDERRGRRAEELVADVFATYVLGFAYPACCMALRIASDGLDTRHEIHPSWRHRVWAMLQTMGQVSAQERTECTRWNDFPAEAEKQARELWRTLSGDDGHTMSQSERARLGLWTHRVTEVLNGFGTLRYAGSRRVAVLAGELETGRTRTAPPGRDTVADALNAAWQWRLSRHRTPDEVRDAVTYCLSRC